MQLPAQLVANPNNRLDILAYNVDEGPLYPILPLQNIELRSSRTLHTKNSPPPVSTKESSNKTNENEFPTHSKQDDLEQGKQIRIVQSPPYPEWLLQPKLTTPLPQFDVLDELRNVYVKIPLLQAIKDIPIYTKAIKEHCLKNPTKKRFNPQTIHVIGNLAGLMSNVISMEKYVDPRIPRVTTIINKISIPNTLIDLGVAINVMTLDTMKTLQVTNLHSTPVVLTLANCSKVIPEGILEDIFIGLLGVSS